MANITKMMHEFALVHFSVMKQIITMDHFMSIDDVNLHPMYKLGSIHISDSVIECFNRTLQCVPAENPCFEGEKRMQKGLNPYGITLFTKYSKESFEHVLDGWLRAMEWHKDNPHYLYLSESINNANVVKNEIIDTLKKLQEFVIALDDTHYIFHYGI